MMYRFQRMSNKLTRQFSTIANAMPRLGADFAFEPAVLSQSAFEYGQTARNRWSRTDLASAIGRDPHQGDLEISVWPPVSR